MDCGHKVRGKGSGMNWEIGTDIRIYTDATACEIASGELLRSTGSSA